jgi:hypothetical protein
MDGKTTAFLEPDTLLRQVFRHSAKTGSKQIFSYRFSKTK